MERTTNVSSNPRSNEPADLSAEIVRIVDRQAGDRVRCRRVYGDKYRCNWLALEKDADGQRGISVDTYQIRQSKFLRVTQTDKGLTIEDLTIAR